MIDTQHMVCYAVKSKNRYFVFINFKAFVKSYILTFYETVNA